MQIEFLLEEPSAAVALENLVPRILGQGHVLIPHIFGGKKDLLSKLGSRLKGYKHCLTADSRIVVLVDEDREECHALKERIEKEAAAAGFVTKTAARSGRRFQVVNRLAVEELEAWFFGDVQAIVQAYPRVPQTWVRKRPFRNPDAIAGGTWEALERVLMKAGYYSAGLPKIETARNISAFMDPARNTSISFQVFAEGLRALIR